MVIIMLTQGQILDIFKEKQVLLEGIFALLPADMPLIICSAHNYYSILMPQDQYANNWLHSMPIRVLL